jgi:hypothetical protein
LINYRILLMLIKYLINHSMVLFIKVRQVNTNLVNKVNIFFINYKKYRTICKSYRKYIKLKKSINNYLKYNYKIIYLYQQINLLFINS